MKLLLHILFWLTIGRIVVLWQRERLLTLYIYHSPVMLTVLDWDDAIHTCGDCGRELTIVRPGKWQCDNPKCESNYHE